MVIDVLLVLGAAVVLPMALGDRWWPWWIVAGATVVALQLPTGSAAGVLVVPWLVVAGRVTWLRLKVLAGGRRPTLAVVARTLAAAYSVVAGASFLASRLGIEVFGIGEPIVELTAIHYTYAGCAALTLAALALDRSTVVGRGRRLAVVAVAITAAAPPIVAVGFVAGAALPQVGGAVLMTLGVWATASLHLAEAAAAGGSAWAGDRVRGRERVLLAVSGLSVWAPMVLAVAWAAGQHWDVPFLSVPDMARTHGVANALGFTIAGLAARRPAWRPEWQPVGIGVGG